MTENKKYHYLIEVEVPNGCKGWQKEVNNRMKGAIEKLRASVEELGGRAFVSTEPLNLEVSLH